MLKSWWKTEEIDDAALDDVISIDSDIMEDDINEPVEKIKIYDSLANEITKMEDKDEFIKEQPHRDIFKGQSYEKYTYKTHNCIHGYCINILSVLYNFFIVKL